MIFLACFPLFTELSPGGFEITLDAQKLGGMMNLNPRLPLSDCQHQEETEEMEEETRPGTGKDEGPDAGPGPGPRSKLDEEYASGWEEDGGEELIDDLLKGDEKEFL